MIRATDLQLNNLILYNNTYWVVDSLSAYPHIGITDGKQQVTISEEYAMPIPLTPEILIDWFGFEKKLLDDINEDDSFYCELKLRTDNEGDKELSIINGDLNGFCEVLLYPYDKLVRYSCVHELQNLIYWLGKKDFKIHINP